jgi:hypothetical protein
MPWFARSVRTAALPSNVGLQSTLHAHARHITARIDRRPPSSTMRTVHIRTECARIHTVANRLAHGRASFLVGTALAEVTTRRENAEMRARGVRHVFVLAGVVAVATGGGMYGCNAAAERKRASGVVNRGRTERRIVALRNACR